MIVWSSGVGDLMVGKVSENISREVQGSLLVNSLSEESSCHTVLIC